MENQFYNDEMERPMKRTSREPLNDQSKGILFGLLGGFFLLGAVALIVLMFIF
ncbi:MAG: hypothetical protein J6K97_02505 [Clostridia bacterium]|nr:hypothetical protein [Clostridia bacterium]